MKKAKDVRLGRGVFFTILTASFFRQTTKKLIIGSSLILLSMCSAILFAANEPELLPKPQSVSWSTGDDFEIKESTKIYII